MLIAGRIGIFFAVLSAVTAQPLIFTADASALTAREVIDGDTIVLETGEHVRLIGIDTPEIDDKFGRNARTARFEELNPAAVDAYAVEAKDAAERWLQGQKIILKYDPVNAARKNRDDYDRVLAYVCRQSDGHCLADDLLAGGYALVYRRFSFERKRDFLAFEDQAKKARRGLWKHAAKKSKPAKRAQRKTPLVKKAK